MLSEVLFARVISQVSGFLAEAGHQRLAKLSSDVLDYHVTPEEAVDMATEAGVKMLVFTHIVPSPPGAAAEKMLMRGVGDSWDGEVLMGDDGMHFTLPGDSGSIERENLAN